MSLSVGIVGLPNVGKSTLFNALTNLQVEAANYPFATIEPNVGIVPVPDERLQKLAVLEKSEKIIPATIEFKDIAGLVAGAHKGAGLGNQFLAHIREVDAIVEVVRFFADPNVIHVDGKVDPKRDIETIETELVLADLQMMEKKYDTLKKTAESGKKEDLLKAALAEKYFTALAAGNLASTVQPTPDESKYLYELPLLTRKPIVYVANESSSVILSPSSLPQGKLSEESMRSFGLRPQDDNRVVLDCQLESEISQLPEDERKKYVKELGLAESGLDKLIKAAYEILGLITFFTAGPKETRAWTCRAGTRAPQAAGVIHTDFEKGFIKAEVINWQTLIDAGGDVAAKEKGLVRQEGKDYIVQDGDVVHFRFNV
ncbi:MAG: GTP-binding protein YchF [Parcubacteria group bacterium GW2011_GWA2_51_12]|nr:MAG: GTP-binding protein YchF [Parcubacteria group bacterium GW2011_GWA2_51_12]